MLKVTANPRAFGARTRELFLLMLLAASVGCESAPQIVLIDGGLDNESSAPPNRSDRENAASADSEPVVPEPMCDNSSCQMLEQRTDSCTGDAPACEDDCPDDPLKLSPGRCGCGVQERSGDRDGDGVLDCLDMCPDEGCAASEGPSCEDGELRRCTVDMRGCAMTVVRACDAGFCWDDARCGAASLSDLGGTVVGVIEDLRLDGLGGVFAAGYVANAPPGTAHNGGQWDALIAAWDRDGTRKWVELLGTSGVDRGQAIAVDLAGRAALVGGLAPESTESTFALATLWPAGAEMATKPTWIANDASGQPGWGYGATFGPDGDLYVTGEVSGAFEGEDNAGASDAMFVRLDAATGTLVWASQWGTTDWDQASAVASDGRNLYVVALEKAAARLTLRKFDPGGGSAIWTETWGPEVSDRFANARVATGPDGAVVVTAQTQPGHVVIKLTAAGETVWTKREAGPWIGGAAVADDGAVYVALYSSVRRYSRTGEHAWEAEVPLSGLRLALEQGDTGVSRVVVAGGDSDIPKVAFLAPAE